MAEHADTIDLRTLLLTPDRLTWLAHARSADDLAALDRALTTSDREEQVVLAIAPMWPRERRRLLAALESRGLDVAPIDLGEHAGRAASDERDRLPKWARPAAAVVGAAMATVHAGRRAVGRGERFVEVTDPNRPVAGCRVRRRAADQPA